MSIFIPSCALSLRLCFVGLCTLFGAAACAPALVPIRVPGDAEVRALEARVASDPDDVASLVALGHAYQVLGRPEEVVSHLERADALSPGHPEATLLLGLAYEDLSRYDEAIERYSTYMRVGPNRMVRRQLRNRMVDLRRQQLIATAREAVAREAELAATPPRPGTVAVFPFLLQAPDPQLRPLGLALADLLITDLSQTDRLTVLDRLRVQALLDEARLAESGLVDPATAVRGGRLLGASRIVQGSIAGDPADLQLRAAVVGIGGELDGRVVPVEESDALARLFDMQKRLALELYRSLGIELTAAERGRVLRRPTANVQALLAYGFGLEAENYGDYRTAHEFFTYALNLDPGFDRARERQDEAARALEAATVTTARIGVQGILEDPFASFAAAEAMVPGEGGVRNPVAELLGTETIGRPGAVIRIILRE